MLEAGHGQTLMCSLYDENHTAKVRHGYRGRDCSSMAEAAGRERRERRACGGGVDSKSDPAVADPEGQCVILVIGRANPLLVVTGSCDGACREVLTATRSTDHRM